MLNKFWITATYKRKLIKELWCKVRNFCQGWPLLLLVPVQSWHSAGRPRCSVRNWTALLQRIDYRQIPDRWLLFHSPGITHFLDFWSHSALYDTPSVFLEGDRLNTFPAPLPLETYDWHKRLLTWELSAGMADHVCRTDLILLGKDAVDEGKDAPVVKSQNQTCRITLWWLPD